MRTLPLCYADPHIRASFIGGLANLDPRIAEGDVTNTNSELDKRAEKYLPSMKQVEMKSEFNKSESYLKKASFFVGN